MPGAQPPLVGVRALIQIEGKNMSNLNEVRAERGDLLALAEKLIGAAKASGKDLAGSELAQYNAVLGNIRRLDGEITQLSAYCASAHMAEGPRLGAQSLRPARSSFRDALKHATLEEMEQVTALAAFISGDIQAAANLTPAGDGGLLIPAIVQQEMERNYLAFAPVVSVCRVWGTDNGEPATFPVLSDSETAAQIASAAVTGADATVSGDTPPTALTGPKLGAYKVSSKPVFIPRETISDSPIDIVGEVLGALLARIIRFENSKYTAGNGTSEAEGFLTNCSHMAAGAVALDLDIALDLAYTVPALYRPNGVYMASDLTIKYLRKLKTGVASDKRYLWGSAFEEATADTPAKLHGYPIIVNNDMDSVATDGTFAAKSPLVFGDFKRFVVRQVNQGIGYIYRYSVPAKDGSAVIMFKRSDSKLLVSTAICKLTVA
jgi:HK97 family phage major capsid protein